ncbi:glycosyltransferase family 4 protein [Nocardioides sp. SYSU DS0663]|uniref:glycosyltransferase family 4 protein n=1 Tax=Nocardioides sp. SYSU DS0663 TaxID=3416445 RepID=UPI003F4B74F0
MRIVHIGPSEVPVVSDRGGAVQRRILELSKVQAQSGNNVVVLSPDSAADNVRVDGVEIVSLGLRARRPLRDYEFLLRARKYLNGFSGDVLHAHGSPDAARVLGGVFRKRVLTVDFFRYRLTSNRYGRRYYVEALRKFDAIAPVSDYCKGEFARFYPEVDVPLTMVPNGVDLGQFKPDAVAADAARRHLKLPPGDLVVYLGRVCEQKGSDLLGPLARLLAESAPETTVVAVGPPDRFGAVGKSDLMRKLESEGVVCTGAVSEHVLAGVLNCASVVVLPTRQNEMFGMAAIEALACGTPVVASDLGGIPQAVGTAGHLFKVGDRAAFHESVLSVLSDDSPPEVRVRHCVEQAAKYRWPEIADMTAAVYAA